MKRLICCFLALQVAGLPCFADVIPTRRVEQNPGAERALKSSLEQAGLSAGEADHQVRDLTPAETEYFARNPDRLQITAGLSWDEWLLGIGALIVFAGVSFVVFD